MATNIWFDNMCVNKNYGCYLKTYTIEPAGVRTITDTVVGADGIVDATEWLGFPVYENREGKFSFLFMPDDGWNNILETIGIWRTRNHGQYVKIKTDDEPNIYYAGRVTFGPVSNIKGSAQFDVIADLDPFRYMDIEKTYTITTYDQIHNYSQYTLNITLAAAGGDWNFRRRFRNADGTYYWSDLNITDGETKEITLSKKTYVVVNPTGSAGSLSVSYTEKFL